MTAQMMVDVILPFLRAVPHAGMMGSVSLGFGMTRIPMKTGVPHAWVQATGSWAERPLPLAISAVETMQASTRGRVLILQHREAAVQIRKPAVVRIANVLTRAEPAEILAGVLVLEHLEIHTVMEGRGKTLTKPQAIAILPVT
jgi:hypothetical protein